MDDVSNRITEDRAFSFSFYSRDILLRLDFKEIANFHSFSEEPQSVWRSEDNLKESIFSLHHMGLWVNWGHWAWQQTPSLSEPAQLPWILWFIFNCVFVSTWVKLPIDTRGIGSLKLEFQIAVKHSVWMLRPKPAPLWEYLLYHGANSWPRILYQHFPPSPPF